MAKLEKKKEKELNVTLSDNVDSKTLSSTFVEKNSFSAFSTIVSNLLEIVLIKFESKSNDSDSDIAFVDTNHELSI